MLTINFTSQFKKDYKRIKKQNKDLSKLQVVTYHLVNGIPLAASYQNHPLTGNWKNHLECHIEPDWLLIYRIAADDIYLERTGSHSQLFN